MASCERGSSATSSVDSLRRGSGRCAPSSASRVTSPRWAAEFSEVRVLRLGVEQARAASVAATLTGRHRDIEHFFGDASFVLDVDGAASNDLGQ